MVLHRIRWLSRRAPRGISCTGCGSRQQRSSGQHGGDDAGLFVQSQGRGRHRRQGGDGFAEPGKIQGHCTGCTRGLAHRRSSHACSIRKVSRNAGDLAGGTFGLQGGYGPSAGIASFEQDSACLAAALSVGRMPDHQCRGELGIGQPGRIHMERRPDHLSAW